jgi:iron-sulfur cluster insertion protein
MVHLTEAAVGKVNEIITQENQAGKALRIYVEGGGCGGFQYGFQFDEEVRDGDEVVGFQGFKLLVDPFSMNYLQNSTVDYVDGLYGAGFRITNPNASGSCGCGNSFSA